MFSILTFLILWTWGLTPLWVNIVGTVFMGFRLFIYLLKLLIAILRK